MRKLIVLLLMCILTASAGCSGTASSDLSDTDDDDAGDDGGGGTSGAPEGSTGEPYDIGSQTLWNLYVSTAGRASDAGTALALPLRTLNAAWDLIPSGALSLTGYRINMVEGSYSCGDDESSCVNYFSDKVGTQEFPIIIRSITASGAESEGGAIIRGGMDISNVSYLYLIDLTMRAGGDYPTNNSGNNVLHLASVDHVLMRDLTLIGPPGRTDTTSTIQEVIKVNQGRDVYLEDSDVSGTFQTVVDFFSVQGGHFLNNVIHASGGRCAYLKGGCAYFRVEGNEFYDCHEAGFQAGEGSDFNLMQSPYLHYEAYDIKVVNNVIHDIDGAGLSVSGGYNILMAYNTLYRIGVSDGRDWTLAQFVLGSRRCTDSATCAGYISSGGFGTTDFDGGEWIPNKNVYVYNNVFYNPAGVTTTYSHFAVNGPSALPAAAENISSPALTDDNLVIKGNIVWNGSGLPLLSSTNGGDTGCAPGNATCNEAQIDADNTINSFEPELTSPASGDFTPVSGGNIATAEAYAIPDFTWDSFVPGVPSGTLGNAVLENRDGSARLGADHPGAY